MRIDLPTGMFGDEVDALLGESASLNDKRAQAVAGLTDARLRLRQTEERHDTALAHAVRSGGANPDGAELKAAGEVVDALEERIEAIDSAHLQIVAELETIWQHGGSDLAVPVGEAAEAARTTCLELSEQLSKAEHQLSMFSQAYQHAIRQIDSPDLLPWQFLAPTVNVSPLRRNASDYVPTSRVRDLLATHFESPVVSGSVELQVAATEAGCRCLEIVVDQRASSMVDGHQRRLVDSGLTRITFVKRIGRVECFIATSSIERDGAEQYVRELAEAAELIFKTKRGNNPTTKDPATMAILNASKPTFTEDEKAEIKREVEARTAALRPDPVSA